MAFKMGSAKSVTQPGIDVTACVGFSVDAGLAVAVAVSVGLLVAVAIDCAWALHDITSSVVTAIVNRAFICFIFPPIKANMSLRDGALTPTLALHCVRCSADEQSPGKDAPLGHEGILLPNQLAYSL